MQLFNWKSANGDDHLQNNRGEKGSIKSAIMEYVDVVSTTNQYGFRISVSDFIFTAVEINPFYYIV